MKKFILKSISFGLMFFIFIGAIIIIVISILGAEKTPALNFSNSYSLNEKICFSKHLEFKPDVFAIGSSMTLNNLHSEEVIEYFDNSKYLNFASWGLKIQEDFKLLKIIEPIYKFNKVLITINVVDFVDERMNINYDYIKYYLEDNDLMSLIYFVKTFNVDYYLENIDYAEYVRNNNKSYEFLGFDSNGMVRFNEKGFNISEKRWNNNHLNSPINYQAYNYLDSIINFCELNEIELYIFHSPFRQGLISKLTKHEEALFELHRNKIKSIVKNAKYVDANDQYWSDTLFVDGIHFNEVGAQFFTEFCFQKVCE